MSRQIRLPQGWNLPKGSHAKLVEHAPDRSHRRPSPVLDDPEPKPSKMKNRVVTVGSQRFASQLEYNRWNVLSNRQRDGLIRDLRHQPRYKCFVNQVLICTYVADFAYDDAATGEHVVEDTKGFLTAIYKLKRRLMRGCHNIVIREITKHDLYA